MSATTIIKAGWTAWVPEVMREAKPACLAFIRRLLKTDSATLYWHSYTRNWVVCVRERVRGRDGVSELQVVSHSPDMGPPVLTRETVETLKSKCFRKHAVMEALDRMESDGASRDHEEHEEFKDRLLMEEKAFRKLRIHDPDNISAADLRKMGEL